MKKKSGWKQLLRSFGLAAGIILAVVIYAFGFQVTKVNLSETKEERRQTQFARILRALAHPNIFRYDMEETVVHTNTIIPCPEDGFPELAAPSAGPYIVMTPACAEPGATVMIEGFHFLANSRGPINFIPPSGVTLNLGQYSADEAGHFTAEVRLPRRSNTEPNEIRAITRVRTGAPEFTQTARDTWDKIIETIFLALLATTLGTLIAVPLSFLAARNLMRDITSPLLAVALNLIMIPVGFAIGGLIANWVGNFSALISRSIAMPTVLVLVTPMLLVYGLRKAMPQEELTEPTTGVRIARLAALIALALIAILGLYLLATLLIAAGSWLGPRLGAFGFLGSFLEDIGDILTIVIVAMTAIGGAGIASGLAGRLGKWFVKALPLGVNKALLVLASAAAGFILFALVTLGLNWFYQFGNAGRVILLPGAVGATAGFVLGLFLHPRRHLPIGLVVYTIARTVFNALRSIESLVMVIVFVVWVGIGPFAGVLALSLHTIAALAKLYSEQIESIMPGPLEAITATGANRLQTIIYAVIPQIVPPYISFTMYRWDINVRMSTIIGFAGGGGIGFLLNQNINQLFYRDASVQMLAIAIVVASMDWLSSQLRERVI